MSETEDTHVEISVDHDALIASCAKWAQEDAERASSAGETRADIKAFLEDTGLNKKALSHVRAGLKLKKQSDREDWLRSMEIILPMAADEIRGQGSPDMFDEDSGS